MRALGTVPGLYFTVSPPQRSRRRCARMSPVSLVGQSVDPLACLFRIEGWRGYQREFGGPRG
jgi:hypothetical protein